MKMFCQ